MSVLRARWAIFFPCLMAASAALFAAPIDDQTPTPNASLVSDYSLSRQQCIHTHQNASSLTEPQRCVFLNISYPATTSGIDDYIRSVLVYRLSGYSYTANTHSEAVDGFLSAQMASLKLQDAGNSTFDFSWRLLGQNNGLSVLVEYVFQRNSVGNEQLLQQFSVLEGNIPTHLDLADILVAGQGSVLASLQEAALLAWFMEQGQLDLNAAQAAMDALALTYSENWAISQGGLVFGYDPISLNGQTKLPLIALSSTDLEGVIRPDILTVARSWPVDVLKQLRGGYQQGVVR